MSLILTDLCLDPKGACDVQTALVERLLDVDFELTPAPTITADKRSAEDSGVYIVVKVNPPGAPVRHGSKNVYPVQIQVTAFAMEQKLSRNDAADMINLVERKLRGSGVTKNEAFCLLQGLPQITKIKDASYMGLVNMPSSIARYIDPDRR